jgi:hypothetical protein
MRVIEKLNTPIGVLGVLVLVVAVNVLLFYLYRQPMEVPATDTATLSNMEGKPTASRTPPSEGGAASLEDGKKVPVVVEVVDAPAGLSIYEDGQLVVDQVSEPGFSQEFEPEEALTISTDNAGAIRTEVGSWDLGLLGAGGEAATRNFTAGT